MKSRFDYVEPYPSLVFGLVGPIGVDIEYISQCLCNSLSGVNYSNHDIRVTELMKTIQSGHTVNESTFFDSYTSKMNYANALRSKFGKKILAALAIGAIRKLSRVQTESNSSHGSAFIVRQLKTPDEAKLFRSVYGKQFIQISIYASEATRAEWLESKIRIKSHGTISENDATQKAIELIQRDQKEDISFGQKLMDIFPMGDLFVDCSNRVAASHEITRFIDALFGSNEVSPTREEYGMYLAKSASLRSSDLSRQVGAAIFSCAGEVISLGSNEVPKAGGGTYWTGDVPDGRDFQKGHDPNEMNKIDVFSDLINRLLEDNLLSENLLNKGGPQSIVEYLLGLDDGRRYKDSRVMDIIEFGRIIHAEMSAICDASRNGLAVKGSTLFCTTFPCHLCAKHIVAAGITSVIFLEPYPKSYALRLHGDAITLSNTNDNKVHFRPFMGIAPLRYRDLFEKGKRKSVSGEAYKWQALPRRPLIDYISSPSKGAEDYVVGKLTEALAEAGIIQDGGDG